MRLLAICGSPRESGNTRRYLELALKEAQTLGAETELVWLGDKTIHGCKGCYGCVQARRCVIEDDFQPILAQMARADGILLGAPTYHASIPCELKALLDRAGFSGRWACNEMKKADEGYTWQGSLFSGKVVAPVTVARRAGQNFAFAGRPATTASFPETLTGT